MLGVSGGSFAYVVSCFWVVCADYLGHLMLPVVCKTWQQDLCILCLQEGLYKDGALCLIFTYYKLDWINNNVTFCWLLRDTQAQNWQNNHLPGTGHLV